MPDRDERWFCHECQAEMQPVMAPDPQCSRCHSSFVEKIENPADDPRDFIRAGDGDDDPFSTDNFLFGLQNLMRATSPPTRARSPGAGATPTPGGGSSGFTIHINRSSAPGEGPRTTFSSRPARTGDVPLLSEFVTRNGGGRAGQDPSREPINGPLMFQYLLAMLSQPGRGGPMADLFGGPGGMQPGRFGDYVFDQEALDQIMTQLMESSSAHPVPATEEIMEKLPREVLEEGSELLTKDCAVCKEQFQLGTEDPDEQVVVTLPCKHPFHEPCIIPWLKSSGTCPVCRYQLVPQPSHHAPGPGPPGGSNPGDNNNSGPNNNGQRSPGQNGSDGAGGFLGNLIHMLGSASGSNNTNNTSANNNGSSSTSTSTERRNSDTSRRRTSQEFPGSWDHHDLD